MEPAFAFGAWSKYPSKLLPSPPSLCTSLSPSGARLHHWIRLDRSRLPELFSRYYLKQLQELPPFGKVGKEVLDLHLGLLREGVHPFDKCFLLKWSLSSWKARPWCHPYQNPSQPQDYVVGGLASCCVSFKSANSKPFILICTFHSNTRPTFFLFTVYSAKFQWFEIKWFYVFFFELPMKTNCSIGQLKKDWSK